MCHGPAVLLLCPAEFRSFGGVDPEDPCDLDPSQDAFADERRVDACILRLCQLPAVWNRCPRLPIATIRDGATGWRTPSSPRKLGRRHGSRSGFWKRSRKVTAGTRCSAPADLLPWEWLGVPLALLSSEQIRTRPRAASFSIARPSCGPAGGARPRTPSGRAPGDGR